MSHKYLVIRCNPNFALFCHLHLQNNSVFKVHVKQSKKNHIVKINIDKYSLPS